MQLPSVPTSVASSSANWRLKLIGPLSKPSKSEFWEGDTEHRSGAYLDVREHSSTGSTSPKTDFEESGKRSNLNLMSTGSKSPKELASVDTSRRIEGLENLL
ncbi:MAG: palindromic element RPE1 domain-containing protein [Holosporales bacterium]|nr:palindromic element RPE1 domain-containing protein [Holosporales bacterium]